ncbi:MAG: 7TM diverse intracellular signaling domain-containing protein [Chitinophagaceae bacterium]
MLQLKRIFLFFLLLHFFIPQPLNAQESSNETFYLYEDSAKQLTGEAALQFFKQGKFTQTATTTLNKGFTRSVFWLAYTNEYNRPADSLLLFIGHHHINIINFFFATDSSIRQQWLTGDYFPFRQRPVNATGFYFPITKEGIYLARIDKSNESLQLSFRLISRIEALTAEAKTKTIMSLFTGMIALLVIFGIYLFLISRDKLYIWYILYISAGWLWVLANAGYGFEYLWPNQPWFASKARPVFAIAPLIFSMLFLKHYIGGIKNKKLLRFITVMNIVLLGCIVSILLFNENGYQSKWWLYIQYFVPLNSLVYAVVILVILTIASIKGNRLAMFYLAAVIVLLITAILQTSFSLGGFNRFSNFLSHYGLAFGYTLEAIILTAGLVYRFNQYRLNEEKLLIEANKRQIENTRILMEVQEAERSQIANQLHDVAGSLLSAAKLNLSSLREKGLIVNDKAINHLEKTEEAVTTVSDMVRNLSHALSPVMLKQVGFKTVLEKVIDIFNASGKINIKLLVLGFEKYNPHYNNYYTVLYSITYELLNNIVKHSGAKNALLQVTEHDNAFTLMAEDNGMGIADEEMKKAQSLGMSGIYSKIDYFSGSIALDKNVPQGLIVTIEIPILK